MEEHLKETFFCNQDYNVWLLFNHTWRAMFKARERELSVHEITPEQTEVLLAVQALGNKATPAAISRSTLREPHTISGLINRMEAKGLLTKNKDLERRNLIRVELTEKGKQAFKESINRKAIFDVIGELKPEERVELCNYLERLQAKALNIIGIEKRPIFPPKTD
jgi:DNA-binding MarR family transcriptional regulator